MAYASCWATSGSLPRQEWDERAHVRELEPHVTDPGAVEGVPRAEPVEEPARQPRRNLSCRAFRVEEVAPVVLHGLQEAIPRAVRSEVCDEEGLVDQRPHQLRHVTRVEVAVCDRSGRGFEREPSAEHREPAKRCLLLGIEESVAPVEQRGHRAMSLGQAPVATAKQSQAVVEARQDLVHVEHRDPGRRDLEREGQSVESLADVGDRLGRVVGEREVGPHGLRSLDEQLHRDRTRKRRHPHHGFPANAEGPTTRCEHSDSWADRDELGRERGACVEVALRVVEHDEGRARS